MQVPTHDNLRRRLFQPARNRGNYWFLKRKRAFGKTDVDLLAS